MTLIIVRSKNIRNISTMLIGILQPSIIAPFSDKNINCVMETTATTNLVICDVISDEAMTDGINMSVKPTTSVFEAASASGKPKMSAGA